MSKIKQICLYGFIPLFVLEYFIMVWDINLNKFIGLPLMFAVAVFSLKFMTVKSDPSTIDRLVKSYFIYNLISFVWFLFSGISIEGYLTLAKYFLFPMFFYFIGREDNYSDLFYKTFMWSMCFVFVIGLFWYITTPGYYLEFLIKQKQNTSYLLGTSALDETNIMNYASLSSFVNVYVTSLLCVPTMAIAYGLLFRREVPYNKVVLYSIGVLSVAVAVLTYQRIAVFCVVMAFLFFCIWGARHNQRSVAISGFILFFIGVAIIGSKYADRAQTMLAMWDEMLKTFSFSDAMEGGRIQQYTKVFSEWNNPLLGSGMGSASAVARLAGKAGVTDGEYVRILIETGIVGFILFLSIIFKTLAVALRNIEKYLIETVIIVFFLAACVGANALSNGQIIPIIFWFAIGKVFNKTELTI